MLRRPLAAYSGGTVRDLHPLPFSLASYDEHLKEFSSYHTVFLWSIAYYPFGHSATTLMIWRRSVLHNLSGVIQSAPVFEP